PGAHRRVRYRADGPATARARSQRLRRVHHHPAPCPRARVPLRRRSRVVLSDQDEAGRGVNRDEPTLYDAAAHFPSPIAHCPLPILVHITYVADIRFPLERANGIQTIETCHALVTRGHEVHLIVRPDTQQPPRDPYVYYDLPRLRGFDIELAPVF